MHQYSLALLLLLVSVAWAAQSEDKYEVGTIMAISEASKNPAPDSKSYEVTIRVHENEYVVLFTPSTGSNRVTFMQGQSILVKLGNQNVTFRDVLGRPVEAAILHKRSVRTPPPRSAPPR